MVISRVSIALTISTAMSKQGNHVSVSFNYREKQLLALISRDRTASFKTLLL